MLVMKFQYLHLVISYVLIFYLYVSVYRWSTCLGHICWAHLFVDVGRSRRLQDRCALLWCHGEVYDDMCLFTSITFRDNLKNSDEFRLLIVYLHYKDLIIGSLKIFVKIFSFVPFLTYFKISKILR